jgi:putative flippase GtrA
VTGIFQFLRFVLTGGTSMLVDLGLLKLLLLLGVDRFVGVAVAFLGGVVVNLLMHKFFTFRDSAHLTRQQMLRFMVVVAINLTTTELVVWLATSMAGLSPLAGKLLSLPPVLAVGFTLARSWVFPAADRNNNGTS